jgi:N-acetylglucosamine-6-phosphate deacetylase
MANHMNKPERRIFYNGRYVLPDRVLEQGALIVEGDTIADVLLDAPDPSSVDEAIDLNGQFLAPGLVDIHIHGSNGVDLMSTDAAGLQKLSEFLLRHGVTRYVPTTVPTDDAGYRQVINLVRQRIKEQKTLPPAARVIGLHFEGPFVNPERSGALHSRYFRTFNSRQAAALFLDKSVAVNFPVRIMTFAPEIEGGLELAAELHKRGYILFIGHSVASLEICEQAAAAGARHITHFPNALAPLHHRRPGIFDWALIRNDVTLDLIADGVHQSWSMIQLSHRVKSSQNIALISDAIAATGLGDGQYAIWGETIRVVNGQTQNAAGAIAGSVITLWHAMRNVREHVASSLVEAINMASLIPARVVGVDDLFGSIQQGKKADLMCFDENLSLSFVCVDGKVTQVSEHSSVVGG